MAINRPHRGRASRGPLLCIPSPPDTASPMCQQHSSWQHTMDKQAVVPDAYSQATGSLHAACQHSIGMADKDSHSLFVTRHNSLRSSVAERYDSFIQAVSE